MNNRNLYIINYLIILVVITIGVIFYFNKIEKFTTLYGQGYGKYGITCEKCPGGEEPSDNLSSCQRCQSTRAGTGGTCA